MAKDDRFQVLHSESLGFLGPDVKILVDQKSGVNYLFTQSGHAGGLTPLLNRDGSPVVTPVSTWQED